MVLMVDEIEWAPRPRSAGTHRRPLWPERLAQFVAQPGKGGYLPGDWAPSVMSDLRRAQKTGVITGLWDFAATTKGARHGRCRLWACYLGED